MFLFFFCLISYHSDLYFLFILLTLGSVCSPFFPNFLGWKLLIQESVVELSIFSFTPVNFCYMYLGLCFSVYAFEEKLDIKFTNNYIKFEKTKHTNQKTGTVRLDTK